MSSNSVNADDITKIFTNGNESVLGAFSVLNVTMGSNICRYVFSKQWTCSKGNYCPESQKSSNCSLGFWCPQNAVEPISCCPGFYCPSPTQIALCPENHFCPMGTVTPVKCYMYDSCPVGTVKPVRYTIYLGIAVLTIFISIVFYVLKKRHVFTRFEKKKNLLILQKLKLRLQQVVCEDMDVEFKSLSLAIDNKQIVSNLSGRLRHGHLCAILGPSGSGKSSFFSLLLQKFKENNKRFKIRGNVSINGVDVSNYKNKISYVPQEDIMIPDLTVDNVLRHSGFMRLNIPLKDKELKVLETIKLLGLSHVMEQKTMELSGGQKKRTNIGLELCSDPNVLLLDEPTSGLDSSTSFDVCMIMKRLANEQNMTVASIIHCPSVKSWQLFDDAIVLSKGKIVYQGPVDLIVEYFTKMGFPYENEHPPEYVLDILSNVVLNEKFLWMRSCHLEKLWIMFNDRLATDENIMKLQYQKSEAPLKADNWVVRTGTRLSAQISLTIMCLVQMLTFVNSIKASDVGAFQQFLLLTKRAMKQFYRNPKRFVVDSVVFIGAGFIASVATSQMTTYTCIGRYPPNVCARAPINLRQTCNNPIDFIPNALSITSLIIFFTAILAALPTFGDELDVYKREVHAGTSTKAYFLAKLLVDFFRMLFAAILFTSTFVMYWSENNLFQTMGVLVFLLYFVGFSMGYFISVLMPRKSAGICGAGFAIVFGYLFSGVQPSLQDIQDPDSIFGPFQWLWSLSASRYAIEAIYVSVVQDLPWEELQSDRLPHGYFKSNFTMNIILIFIIGCMWHLATLFLLIRIKNK